MTFLRSLEMDMIPFGLVPHSENHFFVFCFFNNGTICNLATYLKGFDLVWFDLTEVFK